MRKTITLYYNIEDSEDQTKYAFLCALGNEKKAFINSLLDKYLKKNDIQTIESMTLEDIAKIKAGCYSKSSKKRGQSTKNTKDIQNKKNTEKKEDNEYAKKTVPEAQQSAKPESEHADAIAQNPLFSTGFSDDDPFLYGADFGGDSYE